MHSGLCCLKGGQHERGMGECTSGSHFGRHPDGFHQLLGRRSRPLRRLRVTGDAVGHCVT